MADPKIVTRTVGIVDPITFDWPKDWPVPRVGDEVDLQSTGTLTVRTVVFYPMGDEEQAEPYVYVVLGRGR